MYDIQLKIEKHIFGGDRETLTEKTEFDKKLHTNPDLKENYELEKAIVDQIKQYAFVYEQIANARMGVTKRGSP